MAAPKTSLTLTATQHQAIAKALGDPRRYDLLKRIARCPGTVPCAKLVETSGVSPATLSHHMKELEAAGLVHSQKDGKFVHYKVDDAVLRAYLHRLKSDLF